MKKILFTGGGGAGSESIYKLLSDIYEIHFADSDIAAISNSIPLDRRHEIPNASNSKFIVELEKLVQINNFDLVVPGVDEELLSISKSKIEAMVPEYNYCKIMLDKYDSMHAIKSKGLAHPKTITILEYTQGSSFHFPCIVKPRSGRGSRDVRILTKPDQIFPFLLLTENTSDKVVLQELIHGQEYTVLMSADNNKTIQFIIPVKVGIKKGITLRAEVDMHKTVIQACTSIHENLPASGCYNIQLILTDDDRVLPFEINPRVSTTFCLSLAYGVNPISAYIGDTECKIKYVGSKINRFWVNYFSS